MITPAYSPTATERILPRLSLDFTTGVLDSRVSVTRALNTATAIGSNGLMAIVNANLPRFDYNPVTLAPRGLLIEEARTNVIRQSEDFSNAIWAKNFGAGVTVLTNQSNGPDGQQRMDRVTSAGAGAGLYQTFTLAFLTVHTVSIFIRQGTAATSQLAIFSTAAGVFVSVTFTWSGGVPSTSASVGSPGNVTYENFGGGLYRLSFTFTSRSSGDHWPVYIPDTTAGLGTGISGYVQLEAGGFVTSYIPTTTTGLVRNADVVTMTGTNFSSWWTATTGSAQVRAIPSIVLGICPVFQFDDNTANNIIALRGNTTNPELYIRSTTDQAQIDAGTITANATYNLTAAWDTNNCAAAVNGGAFVTDLSANIPIATQARIGSDGTNFLNGYVQILRYWPQRIINPEVQAFSK